MVGQYYRAVEIDAEGNSVEPVNYVGCHPFNWKLGVEFKFPHNPPEMGFVETRIDMEGLREILNNIQYTIESSIANDTQDVFFLKNLWNDISDFINKVEGK